MRKVQQLLLVMLVMMVVAACGTNGAGTNSAPVNAPAAPPASNGNASGSNEEEASEAVDETGIGAPETTNVTLRLNWKFKGEFAPFFVTKEKGIFEKYGLNVEVLEGSGSIKTMQVVARGNDTFGVTSTVEPMQGIEQGMPVKLIASYMSKSPIMIASYPDNPVNEPKDLEGKKIAMSVASTFTSVFDKFLETNGVDASLVQDIKVETGARNTVFLNREVDAVAIFSTNEYAVFEQTLGMSLTPLYLGDFGYDLAGLSLVGNDRFMEENPNTVKRFLAAIDEGFRYTVENPEEAAAISKQLFPDTVDEALALEQIRRTAELAVFPDVPYGYISEENIEDTANVLLQSALIEEKLPLSEYYTNEYYMAD